MALDKRVSAEIASSSTFQEAPGTATVETWENQRWYPVLGWTPQTLPTDPPHWSSAALPFRELPKDSSEFDLPSAVRSTRSQRSWVVASALFPPRHVPPAPVS